MGAFAVVALLPETLPGRGDYASREFDTWAELAQLMGELDTAQPGWRAVTICHVEDLPLLRDG